MPKTINVKTENSHYQVIIQGGIINDLNTYIERDQVVFIITDNNVKKYYLDIVLRQFEFVNYFIVKAGEASKNIDTVIQIIAKLDEIKADKETLIIALGGGVIGDIAGLVAMLYRRGIKYMSIPTTTLSQIDSSVGGKVAINHQKSKNLIGGFYQPILVLIDTNTLKTLPQKHFNAGLTEAVKIGLSSNKVLFDLMLNNKLSDYIETIIYEAILTKAKIVEVDEYDQSVRNILNFGHTLGHALEMHYQLIHGEAVMLGLLNSNITENIKADLLKIAEKLNLLTEIKLPNALYDLMLKDKKIKKGLIELVVVEAIGEGYLKAFPTSYLKEFLDE